jgi:2-haloacid dehalogenase
MASLASCRACVFDAYGTLFDVTAPAQRETAALGDKAAPLAALWRQKQLEYTWLRSLMGRHADFWQVTGDALDFALATLAIEDAALRERLMRLYLSLDAYPDVAPALARLRAGGRGTAILTNGSPATIEAAVASSGLGPLLDQLLSVEAVGVFKPHRSVYQLAVDRLGLEASRICFVSTNSWDALGAADFGFQVVWLDRFGRQPDRLPGTPAATIKSLAALPDLLG